MRVCFDMSQVKSRDFDKEIKECQDNIIKFISFHFQVYSYSTPQFCLRVSSLLSSVMEHAHLLAEVYGDPGQPGSFMSAEKLQKAVKELHDVDIPLNDIFDWLKTKDTYTKFRVARRTIKRNPIIAPRIDAQWQGDLAEMGDLAEYNDDVRFLFVVIDVVSKFLWVEPLKSKHGKVVLEGFKKILSRSGERIPERFQTDDGKEFLNKDFQGFLKSKKIRFFTVASDKKASIAERVIRTLKEKIYRFNHEWHTLRYVDVLQDLVRSYNSTFHSSIKMAPNEVTEGNEGEVLGNLYRDTWKEDRIDKKHNRKDKFAKDDRVRMSDLKGPFTKGYWGNWSNEVLLVSKVKGRVPYTMYKLKDWKGEELKGAFYEKEVQGVKKEIDGFWKVEKVLDEKPKGKTKRKKMFLVKWEGYPDSFNSWVRGKDIKWLNRGKRGQ
jgi:hypothetical protein